MRYTCRFYFFLNLKYFIIRNKCSTWKSKSKILLKIFWTINVETLFSEWHYNIRLNSLVWSTFSRILLTFTFFSQGTRIKQRKQEKTASRLEKDKSKNSQNENSSEITEEEKNSESYRKETRDDSHSKSSAGVSPYLKRKQIEDSTEVPHKKERHENKVFISSLFRFNPEIPSVERCVFTSVY